MSFTKSVPSLHDENPFLKGPESPESSSYNGPLETMSMGEDATRLLENQIDEPKDDFEDDTTNNH
jgi:hypothetical protein